MMNEVENHLSLNADVLENTSASKDPVEHLQNIYKIFKAVEPLLKLVKGFLFFKPKWQAAIQKLIDVLDATDVAQ